MKGLFSVIQSVFMIVGLAWNARAAQQTITVPLRFDHYYTYEMVVEALQALHRKYPDKTRLDLVGRSEEGREIYCMTVNNPATGEPLSKPGIYVDGNIHGNEIQAGEVALYLLDYLLGQYDINVEIKDLVDRKCFYVVPVVNVDGRHHFFADPGTSSSNRGLRIPTDDDHDGLIDEDFPDDLDGDGNICQMRIKDPFGTYKSDPQDKRLMVRIKPGEQGEWRLLGFEGIDNDGDGRINEDEEGYVDPNRNWGYGWMPPYVQSGAGNFPFSSKGMKALADFISARPNICVGWAFHNTGGMFLRGPSTQSQGEYDPKDIAVYDYLGNQAERITPGYRYLVSWQDLYETHGDFSEWMAMIMGAYTFVGELYRVEDETFATAREKEQNPEPPGGGGNFFHRNIRLDRERLLFNDHLVHGRLYKEWHAYRHPVYGEIEIGGWTKMSTRLPDPFMLLDQVHRNAAAVIFSARQSPDVRLEVFENEKIGANLVRLRVRLINTGAIPTMSYHAQKVNLYPRDMLQVSGPGLRVVAGGKIKNVFEDQVEYKRYRPELQFLFVPGFGKVEYQFLIHGDGQAIVLYQSRHAGSLQKHVRIKS